MNTLKQFLESEHVNDEAMYFIEMHGFLTSLAIQSGELTQQQILDNIFVETPSDELINSVDTLLKEIEKALLNGDFPDMISDDEDEEALTLWAAGFMQGVFGQEQAWFNSHPEEVAELTLPILSCSELLDEAEDMQLDDEMLDDMAEKIPDCVIDLYLLFNAPEDK